MEYSPGLGDSTAKLWGLLRSSTKGIKRTFTPSRNVVLNSLVVRLCVNACVGT
jgi:hypothetical protein